MRAPKGVRIPDPPVAQLVAEAFYDDEPVARYLAGYLALFSEIRCQVAGRYRVQWGLSSDPGSHFIGLECGSLAT